MLFPQFVINSKTETWKQRSSFFFLNTKELHHTEEVMVMVIKYSWAVIFVIMFNGILGLWGFTHFAFKPVKTVQSIHSFGKHSELIVSVRHAGLWIEK